MSSVTVEYPAEVKEYSVSVGRERATIALRGIEKDGQQLQLIARMEFGANPIGDHDFVTRGGYLRMDRSIGMLAGILDLLRNEKPLFLREDGTLASTMEPVGEGE
jgi:hypothetical protein